MPSQRTLERHVQGGRGGWAGAVATAVEVLDVSFGRRAVIPLLVVAVVAIGLVLFARSRDRHYIHTCGRDYARSRFGGFTFDEVRQRSTPNAVHALPEAQNQTQQRIITPARDVRPCPIIIYVLRSDGLWHEYAIRGGP